MFTVLSNTRNTNLYLIVALAIALVAILSLAVVPTIVTPKSAVIPVTGMSEYADYYQRHLELRVPGATTVDMTGDFYLRHPELRPSRESNDLSDYFLRH